MEVPWTSDNPHVRRLIIQQQQQQHLLALKHILFLAKCIIYTCKDMDNNNYENKVIIMKTMQWEKLTNILLIYNIRYVPLTSITPVGNKIM